MAKNRFYDIHFHAMNLSHPNLLAFIKRFKLHVILMGATFLAPLYGVFGKRHIRRIENLLSIMENDIADLFLIVEYFLKKSYMYNRNKKTIKIGKQEYDKIVLTPLMMDFGTKNIELSTFYNIPPKKPITEQVVDIFNGIKKYCKTKLVDQGDKIKYVDDKKNDKLFEIYPFLGINTKKYTPKEIEEHILNKYFSGYSGRRNDFYNMMGTFNGNIDDLKDHTFAGIKLYPPLGFEPWPEETCGERGKVKMLYSFCENRQIPITIHCSDGGFLLKKEYQSYSSPFNYDEILSLFPKLKINLAHIGHQEKSFFGCEKTTWMEKVLSLVKTNEQVYTDFSCRALKPAYYSELAALFKGAGKGNNKLMEKILFGSDFMINLIWIRSYNAYLKFFHDTKALTDDDKIMFAQTNPNKFLFK